MSESAGIAMPEQCRCMLGRSWTISCPMRLIQIASSLVALLEHSKARTAGHPPSLIKFGQLHASCATPVDICMNHPVADYTRHMLSSTFRKQHLRLLTMSDRCCGKRSRRCECRRSLMLWMNWRAWRLSSARPSHLLPKPLPSLYAQSLLSL